MTYAKIKIRFKKLDDHFFVSQRWICRKEEHENISKAELKHITNKENR